jgi:predicted transcriptional regulator
MENEKEDKNLKKELEDKEKIRKYLEQMAQSKKSPVAKDLVQLKHVEVKKQKISPETLDLAITLKEQYLEHDQFERLNNDELTILESFISKRMLLTRIAIVANQSRIPLGIEPFKKAELEKILDTLISKGYLEVEQVEGNNVYILTERGKYRIQ